MVARVGTLAVGTRFVTLATGREGRVLGQHGEDGTVVDWGGYPARLPLHPDVRVRVVEVTH